MSTKAVSSWGPAMQLCSQIIGAKQAASSSATSTHHLPCEAPELMEGVVAQARASGERIVPLCGYARTWLHRHRAHRDLIG
ncbi:GNAT family N-acetyltransferase [Salmonella enterica]|uniref:GNAT family N-acetyltransferase n=1 Tax=Salmonella enterica TaxID=28901 RepID=UPI00352779BB